MSWGLSFHSQALREFEKLDNALKAQFRLRLEKLIRNPAGPGSELSGELIGWNKIKLRQDGYRMIYFRDPANEIIRVLAVGRRDEKVYERAATRLRSEQ